MHVESARDDTPATAITSSFSAASLAMTDETTTTTINTAEEVLKEMLLCDSDFNHSEYISMRLVLKRKEAANDDEDDDDDHHHDDCSSTTSVNNKRSRPATVADDESNQRAVPDLLLNCRFRPFELAQIEPLEHDLRHHKRNKSSLLNVVERNVQCKQVYAPFDTFAYMSLHHHCLPAEISHNALALCRRRSSSCCSLDEGEEAAALVQLMPSSVSSHLVSTVFFDVFSVTQLEAMHRLTLNSLLELKRGENDNRSAVTPHRNELANDLMWHCFALYKFKFGRDQETRRGLFNYVLALLQRTPAGQQRVLQRLLPCLVEALVLNGLLGKYELDVIARKFAATGDSGTTMSLVAMQQQQQQPMSLKRLCRVNVKTSLVDYSPSGVRQLAMLPSELQHFLLYDSEFQCAMRRYKRVVG